ncbi:ABC transporter substrate-binding protein [Paenibacillus roseipurpureus]|uniref:Sugar ABC transporter substrate-binding protein n=1 Tax=Paenibacillus roseopurpureus TaxID=2918901 RepID=A0AA96LT39_9BACL|nr:sugar ABC transporter substrate-binding protein [Paenibacillus sp. MBLB1832]WNR46031.1 sugar ABC transporter substrate-binding protein [Paenibacillus sp. MBLB1832]
MRKNGSTAALALLLILFVILTGCSTKSKEPTESAAANTVSSSQESSKPTKSTENVELRYMMWDQNQEPAYRQALDIFTKKNPNIKVKIEVVAWADYWKKLKTQAAGEVVPDLFWTYVGPIPDLAEKNLLYDMTALAKDVDMTKYNNTLVKNLQYKGKTYGLPKDWDSLALFYNKDLLKKAGYDQVPSDLAWNPKDGGTFLQFLQKLTLDKNGKHPNESGFDPKNIKQYGFAVETSPQMIVSYLVGNGGKIQGEDGSLVIDSPEAMEAIKFLHDLVFKYHVAPTASELTATAAEAMFNSQRMALWMTGPWMMKPLKANAPFAWGITANPAGPKGQVTRINGLTDSIYANTKHPEEALAVAKFLAGKETQDILGDTGTVFPAYKDSINKFVDFYKTQKLDTSPFVEAMNHITVGDPSSAKWDLVMDEWTKNISLAFNGELDIDKAIKTIVEKGNKAQAK